MPFHRGREYRVTPAAPLLRKCNLRGLARMVLAVCLAGLLLPTGCSRKYYRNQADEEVYGLVKQSVVHNHSELVDYSIAVDPRSRLYDPTDPDRPPMPPDDPAAHELMHYVDGKKGYPHWHDHGDIPYVDSGNWKQYLPRENDDELVVDLPTAVQLARTHSREYQRELEDLYLSALDVTFERFRFDAQFFGGNDTFFTADGPVRAGGVASSTLVNDSPLGVRRLFTTGGQMTADIANSIVWQFSGNDTQVSTSLIDFTLIQPLLRAGGRARVMETLTLSERTLLSNIRQMEQYQLGFYNRIVTGEGPGPGPSRGGGFFGGSGFTGFTGVGGGGFGRVGGFASGAFSGGGGVTGGAGAGQAGGFLGILQTQQQIYNQTSNVSSLRSSREQLEAAYDAGRIDRFQVDLATQALYNAQSVLLQRQNQYETLLDAYKIELGLPPDLPLKVEDPLLDRFTLIDPAWTSTQDEVSESLAILRKPQQVPTREILASELEHATLLRSRVEQLQAELEADLQLLEENLPDRRAMLRRLASREEDSSDELEVMAFDEQALLDRAAQLERDHRGLRERFEGLWLRLERVQEAAEDGLPADRLRDELVSVYSELSGRILEFSLLQARARLDSVTLVPIDVDSGDAFQVARRNRRDLMNARAQLVNSWRLIEYNANALKSNLDLVFTGDLGTVGDEPLRFRDTNGRLRAGVEFDAPLTRLAERNQFRQAQIEYQQARRSFMETEDLIHRGIRANLRNLALNQVNFELRRAAVQIAINQVDLARLRLNEPPKPGVAAEFGATTALNLVNSLSDLLNVQNDFLSVWVNYEALRVNLDFQLGTMRLDSQGLWLDPGPISGTQVLQMAEYEEEETLDIPPPLPDTLEDPEPRELPAPDEE